MPGGCPYQAARPREGRTVDHNTLLIIVLVLQIVTLLIGIGPWIRR